MCREVVLSTKAYLTIVTETLAHLSTETGGILLGKRSEDVWYVIEAIDAGMQAIFRAAYFEYDTPYVNHLANHVARLYENRLELLGLWHRHPGSMDTFSSTDDETNAKYAALGPNGSISALVNLDPDFRLTMYHVSLPLHYLPMPVRWGDEHVPKHLLAFKSVDDVLAKLNRRQDVIPTEMAGPFTTTQASTSSSNSAVDVLVDSVRDGIRTFRQSWSRRRPGPPPSTQPDAGSMSTWNPNLSPQPAASQDQAAGLDMLEQELDYIETQRDYKCTMRVQGEKVVVDMEYLHAMPYFPPRLVCVLGVKPDGQQYIQINGHEIPYVAGAIRAYVDQAVRSAMDRSPSERGRL